MIKIDGHSFIFTEVESAGRAFYLKLAEAYPAPFSTKPVIVLQTKHQLQKQVLDFLNRPKDAARFAREQAQRAREIATEWKTIGAKMDTALDGVIANYKKLQETAVDLARTGHSAPPNMNHYVIKYLSHVLWNAGIDLTGGFLGIPERGSTFENILAAQAGYVHTKTAHVIGDLVEPPKVEEAPEVERLPEEPCMTFHKSNEALESWEASRRTA